MSRPARLECAVFIVVLPTGRGTTVKLNMPHANPTLATYESHRESTGYYSRTEEDDESLRAVSASALKELGYSVVEAGPTGRSALERLRADPTIDLIFTNVVLPQGMIGRQLAEEALRIKLSTRFLLTTRYMRNAIAHNGTLDPDVNLLGKPCTFGGLGAEDTPGPRQSRDSLRDSLGVRCR